MTQARETAVIKKFFAGSEHQIVSGPQGQRGQVLILARLFFSVVLVIGAYAIDQGLFLGQRRLSQKDADVAALAGASELLLGGDPAAAARSIVTRNEPSGNANVAENPLVDSSCVTVKVKVPPAGLFLKAAGINPPSDIGAQAKACVGVAQAPSSVVPFVISRNNGSCFDGSGQPIFGATCKITIKNANGSSPPILNLESSTDACSDDRSGSVSGQVANGSDGTCLVENNPDCSGAGPWYDCAAVRNGDAAAVIDGLGTRLARPDSCGGTDFGGAAYLISGSGSDGFYQPADCDPSTTGVQMSPRLVTLAVLPQDPPSGNSVRPISAFAAFYIDGCGPEGGPIDPTCAPLAASNTSAEARHIILAAFNAAPAAAQPTKTPKPTDTPKPTKTPKPTDTPVPPSATPTGVATRQVVFGHLLKLVLAGHTAGPANSATTIFSISLGD